ncbi:hypothetical protein ACFE04_016233 [Oxalis oulophora]
MLITSLPPSMDDELFQTAPQQQEIHNQYMFYDYYSVSPPPPPLMMTSNVTYLINCYPLYQTVTASPEYSLYYPSFYPLSYADDVNKVSKPDEKPISSVVASKGTQLEMNLDNGVKSTLVKVSKPITVVKPKASRRITKGNPMEAISRGPRLMMHNRPCVEDRWVKKDNYKTTLMIRNIPNHYKRDYLLDLLDKHCFDENEKADSISDPVRSAYDFVYLPMDFGYHLNLGYGFVNFTNPVGASRFRRAYDEFVWESGNRKICKIRWGRSQGKEECIKEVVNKTLKCTSDGYLPVVFSPPRDGRSFSEAEIVGTRIVPLPHETHGKMLKCRRSKK